MWPFFTVVDGWIGDPPTWLLVAFQHERAATDSLRRYIRRDSRTIHEKKNNLLRIMKLI